ncbi:MAG: ankyrin repeat domain-containing protein, partial [Candidatus Aminicenantes bacterium]
MKKMYTLSLCLLILLCSVKMLSAADIHKAAQKGDIETVRSLVENNPDIVNAVDDNKRTPLHYAALSQNQALVEFLLSKGADIKARELNGGIPLHFAAYGGNTAVVSILLQKGSDLHAKNNMGQTPAFYAAMNGHLEVLQNLVNRGAEVNIKDTRNWSPVLLASWSGHTDVVSFLLQKGVDINAAKEETWASIHAAAFAGHTEVCRVLVEHNPKLLNTPSRNGDTPLHWAIHRSHIKTVTLLLEKGADLTIANARGLLPIHAAIDA